MPSTIAGFEPLVGDGDTLGGDVDVAFFVHILAGEAGKAIGPSRHADVVKWPEGALRDAARAGDRVVGPGLNRLAERARPLSRLFSSAVVLTATVAVTPEAGRSRETQLAIRAAGGKVAARHSSIRPLSL